MRVIIHQFEILEFEIEDTFHIRVDFHLRQRTRFAGQLQFYLFQMIQIDMCVTECMNEVTCATICSNSAYEAMLKGTPRKMSALRW